MREINEIIVHCSATPEGREVTAKDIDRWHTERGFRGIGYHYVIKLDGTIENGRPENEVGAHCLGHNKNSIGVCYVGGCDKDMKPKDTRTQQQRVSLILLLANLKKKYPNATVRGHNEFVNKACPSFSVQDEYGYLNVKNE